jgi:hypothetical protein
MADGNDDFTLLRQYRSAAISALAAGDYSTAINQALAAQLTLSTMPSNLSRSAGTGGGAQTVAWPSEAIDAFIIRCRQQQASASGVTVANIRHRPASCQRGQW